MNVRAVVRRGALAMAMSWSVLAAAQMSLPSPILPGDCDPKMATCTKVCTPLSASLGLCKPGDTGPGGPGTGPGGGMCKASPIGGPVCTAGGPSSLPLSEPAPGGGNPINFVTGNKWQEETDLAPLPGVLGLEFKRYYNSLSSHPGLLGAGWRMSYETILYDLGNQIQIVQADGRRLTFQRGLNGNASLCSSAHAEDGQVRIEEAKGVGGSPTYHWRWADGRTLTFSSGSGGGNPLQSVTAPGGQRLTLLYNGAGDLISVRDPQGRQLSFIYAGAGSGRSRALQAVDTPLGRLSFTQDRLGRLTAVASAKDAKSAPYETRIYHYEDRYNGGHPLALTGISVRTESSAGSSSQRRLSTYAYDTSGLAILSTKGLPRQTKDGQRVPGTGVDQIDVRYVERALPFEGGIDRRTGEVVPRQMGKTVVTDEQGRTTEILHAVIDGQYRLVEMRGAGCTNCGPSNRRYAYDASGRLVRESRIDQAGHVLSSTLTRYDEAGRVVQTGILAKDAREPVWQERLGYEDRRYQDGNVALAMQPSLIVRPSVAPGREATTRIRYGRPGTAWADKPIEIEQTGWAPDAASPQGFVRLHRTMRFAYVQDGPAAGEIAQADGALPNGPAASPMDSDITRHVYDRRGLLSEIVHPSGLKTTFGFDEFGRLVEERGPDGVSVTWHYDERGRVDGIARSGVNLKAQWGEDGRLAAWLRNDGKRLPASEWVAPSVDGEADRYQLDDQGRVVQLGAQGARLSYANVLSRTPMAVTAPDGTRSSRSFDDFGRVVRMDNTDTGASTARYDDADRPIEIVDASGRVTRFEYDLLGRVVKRLDLTKGGSADATVYRYDGIKLVSVANLAQADGFDWDAQGRVVRRVTRVGAASYVTGYHYDTLGRLVRKTLPGGLELLYTHGSDGGLTSIGLLRPNGDMSVLARSPRLDAQGAVADVVLGDGLWAKGLPALSPQAAIAGAPMVGAEPFLRAANAQTPTASPQPTSYDYDLAGRLTSLRQGQHVETFEYDALSNRVSSVRHANDGTTIARRWSYETGTHRTTSLEETAGSTNRVLRYEHDASGRVVAIGDRSFGYGASGRIERVAQGGQALASYAYNGGGERALKRVRSPDGVTQETQFLYSAGRISAEADATGHVLAHYVYWDGHPIAKVEPHARAGARVTYLHTDAVGAVNFATDDAGKLIWRADYDAMGEATVWKSAGAADLNLRLAGQYFDAETGNHYNYFRDYDPKSGRYLEPDPAGVSGGANPYAFAANDPVNHSDALGLMPEPDDGSGGSVPNPTFFGTAVHIMFSGQVRTLGTGWGGNDSRSMPGLGSTWPALRPDAYSVTPTNLALEAAGSPFKGTLWELKPIGWYWDAGKYSMATTEVATYMSTAKRGCWMAGSSKAIVSAVPRSQIVYDGKLWDITYINDNKVDMSGLVFYAKKEVKKKEKPSPVPAPAPKLTEDEDKQLKRAMDQIKDEGAKEGWSGWEIAGMVVLIALAIAALIALVASSVAAVVAAIVASIAAALAAVAEGAISLISAMALLFGLGAASTAAAAATEKGKEKEAGLLDSTIAWFKSWF